MTAAFIRHLPGRIVVPFKLGCNDNAPALIPRLQRQIAGHYIVRMPL